VSCDTPTGVEAFLAYWDLPTSGFDTVFHSEYVTTCVGLDDTSSHLLSYIGSALGLRHPIQPKATPIISQTCDRN
jgi:hypothetical protein